MADRKAVNKYYPPEWTPNKGSINKFRGTHALRERARKLDQGILIIRFEMPYNIWCEGCKNHIGMGVRYNAEKSKVGMYYTTTIWKFKMKCHLCDNYIVMKTDPANFDYVIESGASRQERRWDPDDNEQVAPEDKEVGKKLATDAMFRLEHGVEDKKKIKSVKPALRRLEDHKEKWKDDYMSNKLLRQKFREKKTSLRIQKDKDDTLLKKASLNINLVPEDDEDRRLAGLLRLVPCETYEEKQKKKRTSIKNRPLFHNPENSSAQIAPAKEVMNSLTVQAMEQKLSSQPKMSTALLGIIKKSAVKKCKLTEGTESNERTIDESDMCKTKKIQSSSIESLCNYSDSNSDENSE